MAAITAADKREALDLLATLRADETDLGGRGYLEGAMDNIRSGQWKADERYLDQLRAAVAKIPPAPETVRQVVLAATRLRRKDADDALVAFERALDNGSTAMAVTALRDLRMAAKAMESVLAGQLVSEHELDDPAGRGLVAEVNGACTA